MGPESKTSFSVTLVNVDKLQVIVFGFLVLLELIGNPERIFFIFSTKKEENEFEI